MKFSVLSFTLAAALAGSLAWSTPAHAAGMACVNDIDCKANGTACGTDICDYNNGQTCAAAGLPANKGMDGWCTVDTDCKCKSLGATCVGVYCTCVTPQGCAGGDAGGGSGAAASGSATSGSAHTGSATSGSATSGSATSGSTKSGSATSGTAGPATSGTAPAGGGGSSSSCSMGVLGSGSPWAGAALALGACFAAGRRRRRA